MPLRQEKNYGLLSLKKLYKNHKFPAPIESVSEAEYLNWWKEQEKIKGTDNIVIEDNAGVKILFDSGSTPGYNKSMFSYFKDHVFKKRDQLRWKYATNLKDIITNPDEIWSRRLNGKIFRFYIKFYKEAPIAVFVADKKGIMVADSIYELYDVRVKEIRRGELIYVKR